MTLASTTVDMLRAYTPANTLEATHHARMLVVAAIGPAAFTRESYTPGHFTASAFVISRDSTRVLLILHGKLQLWLQPGGHVEASDGSLVEAARRELLEETGLVNVSLVQATPFDIDVHTIPARGDVPKHEHFDVRFLFQTSDTDYRASSDALDAKWIDIENLTTANTDESVRRAAQKIARLTR